MIRYKITDLDTIRKNWDLSNKLSRLSWNWSGVLSPALKKYNYNSPVIICYINNAPVGWITTIKNYNYLNAHPVALYVKSSARNKGIGTQLLNKYSKISKEDKVVVVVSSATSNRLFNEVKLSWTQEKPLEIFGSTMKFIPTNKKDFLFVLNKFSLWPNPRKSKISHHKEKKGLYAI